VAVAGCAQDGNAIGRRASLVQDIGKATTTGGIARRQSTVAGKSSAESSLLGVVDAVLSKKRGQAAKGTMIAQLRTKVRHVTMPPPTPVKPQRRLRGFAIPTGLLIP
jgi:hypothetical protein